MFRRTVARGLNEVQGFNLKGASSPTLLIVFIIIKAFERMKTLLIITVRVYLLNYYGYGFYEARHYATLNVKYVKEYIGRQYVRVYFMLTFVF